MPFLFGKIEDARDHIITGILLVVAITLLVTRHDGGLQNTRILAMTAVSYLEQPLSSVRVYRTALQTNRELQRENVLLLDELSRLRSANEEIDQLRKLLEFRDKYQTDFNLLPARVVGKNLTGIRNMISVDLGRSDGVEVGMPVVNSSGLIGRVVLTGNNYSHVMPINNTMFRASANIQGIRAHGIISWSGNSDDLILNYVPQTVAIEAGMIVETSGLSNTFPPNIPIGTIIRSRPEPGRDTQIIHVAPFIDLNTLSEAFVIQFTPIAEIDSLNIQYESMF